MRTTLSVTGLTSSATGLLSSLSADEDGGVGSLGVDSDMVDNTEAETLREEVRSYARQLPSKNLY